MWPTSIGHDPHQGIGQQIPEQRSSVPSSQGAGGKVIARPVMGGLHHDYL
jgi:hypothetical protein